MKSDPQTGLPLVGVFDNSETMKMLADGLERMGRAKALADIKASEDFRKMLALAELRASCGAEPKTIKFRRWVPFKDANG